MEQNFYNNFKHLLSYFVSHLEWVEAKNDSSKGFKIYIEPLINSKNFKRTGQGYSGDKIQNQISQWSHYAQGEICINIQSNFGDYKTSKCYLNWKSTGLNIIAKWVDTKVVALYQEEYCYWEKPPTRLPISEAKSIDVLGLFDEEVDANSDLISFFEDFQNEIIRYKKLERDKKQMEHTNSYIKLLEYKKQIILQGPPGTGKTRLAKEIARELLIEDLKKTFTEVDLLAIVKEKTTINTFTNYNSFEIVKIDSNSFKIYPKGAKLEYKVFFSDVIDCIKDFNANDLVKKYDKKGVGTYLVGIAKYVIDSLETVRQQIIQFHPSYTYEDFVRGITVKPNPDGDGVLYEAENKILGAFANEAFQNYKLSRKQVSISVSDVELFDLFINDIKEKIADSDEQRFSLTNAVYLFEPDEKRFKYKGDNWIAHSKGLNMKFSELQKIIASNVTERAQVKQLDGVEELTKQHATYFIKVVEMFYEFKSNHSSNQTNKEIKTALKNYILIIDEINRANLSSVLGELIYALEYRGESVDSMYAIDGNNKLTLPPNLFIIGTMNTADRSVGHIDYAIRRRFAFVDVLPEILEVNDFDKDLFTTVAKLFVKEWDNQWESSSYLSPEFAPKDVMLGHSYFIKQYEKDENGNNINDKPYDFKMRVKYEIVPILREYVKDGILNEKACNEISKIENAYLI